jgi:hypothetical protein
VSVFGHIPKCVAMLFHVAYINHIVLFCSTCGFHLIVFNHSYINSTIGVDPLIDFSHNNTFTHVVIVIKFSQVIRNMIMWHHETNFNHTINTMNTHMLQTIHVLG